MEEEEEEEEEGEERKTSLMAACEPWVGDLPVEATNTLEEGGVGEHVVGGRMDGNPARTYFENPPLPIWYQI